MEKKQIDRITGFGELLGVIIAFLYFWPLGIAILILICTSLIIKNKKKKRLELGLELLISVLVIIAAIVGDDFVATRVILVSAYLLLRWLILPLVYLICILTIISIIAWVKIRNLQLI